MPEIAPFDRPGRFWRGGLHTHSDRSDGLRTPEQVCAHYRDAGWDFLALTDHFREMYDFPVVDTRGFRTKSFTTLFGAELHAPQTRLGEIWHLLAVGLPLDFAPTGKDEDGPALARRAAQAGAYVAIPHPNWYQLDLEDARTIEVAHAVEVYNHTCAVRMDRADGTGLLDAMLNDGLRVNAIAVDDAHFKGMDACGGWVMVKAEANEPEALLAALKRGEHYSSQGPQIRELSVEGEVIEIVTSPADAVIALGRGSRSASQVIPGQTRTRLELGRVAESPWLRVVVMDKHGRRAWTNPIWRA